MKLPALLVSDTHLTAKPADEYRWGLFPFLEQVIKKYMVQTLIHAGDLTDAKDYHVSTLTNRVVRSVAGLASSGAEVWVMHGNHDYLRRGHAYFEFLSTVPGCNFVTRPMELPDAGKGPLTFLAPHSREPAVDWRGLDFSHYDFMIMHQTVTGSRASNGQVMTGEEMPALNAVKTWSGDIHVPQVIGAVEYIGSPYHVHFGDDFQPRCVLIDRRRQVIDLHFDTIKRITIDACSPEDMLMNLLFVRPGDQVKVKVWLEPSVRHDWRVIERECVAVLKASKADVHSLEMRADSKAHAKDIGIGGQRTRSLTDDEAILRFVESNELGADAYEAGLEVLR